MCRTKEALKRLNDGDIIQNLDSEDYFQKIDGSVYISKDCMNWKKFEIPMYTFPPYNEWRSVTNLHYYHDLKIEKSEEEKLFLTVDKKVVDKNHPKADREKKRWFMGKPRDWLK